MTTTSSRPTGKFSTLPPSGPYSRQTGSAHPKPHANPRWRGKIFVFEIEINVRYFSHHATSPFITMTMTIATAAGYDCFVTLRERLHTHTHSLRKTKRTPCLLCLLSLRVIMFSYHIPDRVIPAPFYNATFLPLSSRSSLENLRNYHRITYVVIKLSAQLSSSFLSSAPVELSLPGGKMEIDPPKLHFGWLGRYGGAGDE